MEELWAILHHREDRINLAYCNLLIASTIPGLEGLDIDACLQRIKSLADEVRGKVERARREGRYATEQALRLSALCTVVQEMGRDYNPDFQKTQLTPEESAALYADPRNVFLHGILLHQEAASCVNMPLIYLALAERLGDPLYGVTVGQHVFVRWDDGRYRMNVEPTITRTIAWTRDEDVYLETEGLTRDDVRGTSWLRNLSKKQMIGEFFMARAGHFITRGPAWWPLAAADLERARHLHPGNPNIQRNLERLRQNLNRENPTTLRPARYDSDVGLWLTADGRRAPDPSQRSETHRVHAHETTITDAVIARSENPDPMK